MNEVGWEAKIGQRLQDERRERHASAGSGRSEERPWGVMHVMSNARNSRRDIL